MTLNEVLYEKLPKKIDSEGDGNAKAEESKENKPRRRRRRNHLNDVKVYIVIPSQYYASKHRTGTSCKKNYRETPYAQHNICIYTCTCHGPNSSDQPPRVCGTNPNDPTRIPCPAFFPHLNNGTRFGARPVPCGCCNGLILLFKSICNMLSECVKYLALCMNPQQTQGIHGLQCTCDPNGPQTEEHPAPPPPVEVEVSAMTASPGARYGFGMKKAAARRLYTATEEETCRLLPTFNLDPREPEVEHLCCGTKKALKKERKWRRKEFKKMKKQRIKIEKLLARADQHCRMGRFAGHESCMVDPKKPYAFM